MPKRRCRYLDIRRLPLPLLGMIHARKNKNAYTRNNKKMCPANSKAPYSTVKLSL